MKFRLMGVLLWIVLVTGTVAAQQIGWERVGGGALNEKASSNLYGARLAMLPNGNPVVMYVDRSINYVRYWTGDAWADVGGVLPDIVKEAAQHDIAVDANGHIAVVWEISEPTQREKNEPRQLVVGEALPDGTWQMLGGKLNEFESLPGRSLSGRITGAQMVATPKGWVVAWREYDANNQPFLIAKRWNGSTWEKLGDPLSATRVSAEPGNDADANFDAREGDIFFDGWLALTTLPTGEPFVAWVDMVADHQMMRLEWWNEISWQPVSPPAEFSPPNPVELSGISGLVMTPDRSATYFAADVDGAPSPVYRYQGGTWTNIGFPGVESNFPPHTRLLVDAQNGLTAVWYDGDAFAARWQDDAWSPVGTGSFGTMIDAMNNDDDIDAVIAPDGSLYVTWIQMSADGMLLYVDKWPG